MIFKMFENEQKREASAFNGLNQTKDKRLKKMNAMKRRRLKNWEIEMEMHETRKPSRRFGSVCVCVCAGWCKRKSHAMHVSNVFGEWHPTWNSAPKWQSNRNFNELTFCWQPKGILSSFAPFNGEHSFQSFPTQMHTEPAIDLWWWLCVVCNCKMCVPIVFFVVIPSNPSRLKRDFFPSIENETFQNRNASTFAQEKSSINCTPTRKKRDKNIGIVLRHLNGCVSMWLAAIWPRIQAKRMHQCGFCSRSDGGKNEK